MKGKKAIAEKVLLEVVGDRNASATVEQIAQSLEGETQPKVSDLRGKTFGLKSVVWIGIGVACSSRCPARTSSCSTIPACGRLSVSPSPRL